MRAKGLTCNEVRQMLQELANQVPPTNELCQSYTVSYIPSTGEDCHPDLAVLKARMKNMDLELRVEYYNDVTSKV